MSNASHRSINCFVVVAGGLTVPFSQGSWDRSVTAELIEQRRAVIQKNIEDRIKTSVEREAYAKLKLREELVRWAERGGAEAVTGIRDLLTMIGDEAASSGAKPRYVDTEDEVSP